MRRGAARGRSPVVWWTPAGFLPEPSLPVRAGGGAPRTVLAASERGTYIHGQKSVGSGEEVGTVIRQLLAAITLGAAAGTVAAGGPARIGIPVGAGTPEESQASGALQPETPEASAAPSQPSRPGSAPPVWPALPAGRQTGATPPEPFGAPVPFQEQTGPASSATPTPVPIPSPPEPATAPGVRPPSPGASPTATPSVASPVELPGMIPGPMQTVSGRSSNPDATPLPLLPGPASGPTAPAPPQLQQPPGAVP